MQTSPPSLGSTLTYVLSAIAITVATGIGAALSTIFGRRKSTSNKENAEARHTDAETIALAWSRIDQMQRRIDELSVEVIALRPLTEENKQVRSWARRMQKVLNEKGIAVPDYWVSGEN